MAARILVINASRDVLTYYQHVLEAEGYGVEISTFQSLQQEELAHWQPDLMIIDLLIDSHQEHTAWQFIRQLKTSAQTASIPLLLCTAALVVPDFSFYAQQLLIPVIFKPLDQTLLKKTVRGLLFPPTTHVD